MFSCSRKTHFAPHEVFVGRYLPRSSPGTKSPKTEALRASGFGVLSSRGRRCSSVSPTSEQAQAMLGVHRH